MEVDWIECWADNRIAFHQQKINSRLVRFWPALGLEAGAAVFVPLCGKTQDMVWLINNGNKVIGSELSDIACRDFFIENNLDYSESSGEKLMQFSAEKITLLQGDIFDITPEILTSVAAVFDRAALIALPPDIRIQYASHLTQILPQDAKILLISMEYDQEKMKGPPYSVTEDEVRRLFSEHFEISILSHSSGPEIVGNLRDRGLKTLDEKVYLLQRIA